MKPPHAFIHETNNTCSHEIKLSLLHKMSVLKASRMLHVQGNGMECFYDRPGSETSWMPWRNVALAWDIVLSASAAFLVVFCSLK
jgi:hypothetical protein